MSHDYFARFLRLLPILLKSEHDPVTTSSADGFHNRTTVQASLSFTPAVICWSLVSLYLFKFPVTKIPTRDFNFLIYSVPIPVAARSKVWFCGRSLEGIVGSNPTGGMDVYSR